MGTEEHPFTGIFDGNGFVIRGVETDGQGPEDRGLFGYIKGGTVEDLGVMSGGIVGLSDDGSVMDCYSAANIEGSCVGGIAGYTLDSKIENCYSTGSITAYQVTGNSGFAGGLAGVLEPYKGVIVTNSVLLNPTLDIGKGSGVNRVIGFLYALEQSSVENSVFRDNYAFSGMKVNGNILSGGTHDNGNGADFSYDAASKTFSKPWEEIFSDTSAWDIEPGKLPTLKGIGGQDGEIPGGPDKPFSSVFDGEGHVIYGVTIRSGSDHAGLFSLVQGGSIQNLGVKDVDISGNAAFAGAIAAGLVDGNIVNCYSAGTVSVDNTNGMVGGIAGSINSTGNQDCEIQNCYSTATVEGGNHIPGHRLGS